MSTDVGKVRERLLQNKGVACVQLQSHTMQNYSVLKLKTSFRKARSVMYPSIEYISREKKA